MHATKQRIEKQILTLMSVSETCPPNMTDWDDALKVYCLQLFDKVGSEFRQHFNDVDVLALEVSNMARQRSLRIEFDRSKISLVEHCDWHLDVAPHRAMADARLLAIPASWSRIADSNPN